MTADPSGGGAPRPSITASTPPDVALIREVIESGREPHPSIFSLRETPGSGVLLTAPHAARHISTTSPQVVKRSDAGTRELAVELATIAGCATLATTPPWPANANADPLERCVFKQRVLHLLREGTCTAVLDLHGMADSHGIDVCVGSGGGGVELAEAAAALLRRHGLAVSVDHPFDAARPGTVTRTVREHGFQAIQLELSATLRTVERKALLVALVPVLALFDPA